MPIEIPNKLYKYRSFDNNGYYRSLLEKNALYFSSPIKFNDPFDCRVAPNYEAGSKSEIYNKFYQHNKEINPHLSPKDLRKLTQKEVAENYNILKDPDLFAKRVNDMMDKLVGVFTLTEKNDNLLMWSHYADSHKGFCVEFDPQRLFEICKNYMRIEELILYKKVKYSTEYPIINPYLIRDSYEDFLDWLILKSSSWEYEQEWRLIYSNHPNELVEFPDDIITAIYFGVNSSDEKIKEAIELSNNRKNKLNYYKGKLRRNEFAIDFISIND